MPSHLSTLTSGGRCHLCVFDFFFLPLQNDNCEIHFPKGFSAQILYKNIWSFNSALHMFSHVGGIYINDKLSKLLFFSSHMLEAYLKYVFKFDCNHEHHH
eukprot:c13854_g1_i2 orf=163-462(-)